MKYTELVITVDAPELEKLCNQMILWGFESFEVYDYNDLEDAIGQVFYDYIDDALLEQKNARPQVKIYFDQDSQAQYTQLLSLLEGSDLASARWETGVVDPQDWENNWKQYFFPFPVGNSLYVKPTWVQADPQESAGRQILEIDPASAFGSGTHATTKLCLEQLEQVLRPGDKVLDMGCGSGILGIGAIKLGAGTVHAVDIDPNAVRVAQENFLANACAPDSFCLSCGDAVSDSAFARQVPTQNRVILANIVAGVIVALAPFFMDKLSADGVLICSGILVERVEEVRQALEHAGFAVCNTQTCEDWAAMVCRKGESRV